MSEIDYLCPSCQQAVSVTSRAAGRTLPCPHCGQMSTVPHMVQERAPERAFDFQERRSEPIIEPPSRKRKVARAQKARLITFTAVLMGTLVASGFWWKISRQPKEAPVSDSNEKWAIPKTPAPGALGPRQSPAAKALPTPVHHANKPVSEWREEARRQYFLALKAKQQAKLRRSEDLAHKLGTMSVGERSQSLAALKMIQKGPITAMPRHLRAKLAYIMPEYAAKLERDAVGQMAAQRGERIPDWWPPEQRSKRYADFAGHLDLEEKWSLVNPFDDLSPAQMEAAIAAAVKAQARGLGGLDAIERQILLDAGALEFFARNLNLVE